MVKHGTMLQEVDSRFQNGLNTMRSRHQWRIKDGEISLGARTLLVGVLDLPSFVRETGKPDRDAILIAAQKMVQDGADLIEVTAQRDPLEREMIGSDGELRRLVPVLRRLRHNLGVPVCVTTCHAATAERAIELGAAVIHDLSGLAVDPHLAPIVNQVGAGLVLGHMRGMPERWSKLQAMSNPVEMVARDLESSIARARAAGIDRRQIVVDPGLGLGKRGPENYQILRELKRLLVLGQAVQISPSRQPFLVESVRSPESERLFATAALAAVAAWEGAHLLRVREVSEIAQVVKLVDRMIDPG
jgi:dihydropteroate synthase